MSSSSSCSFDVHSHIVESHVWTQWLWIHVPDSIVLCCLHVHATIAIQMEEGM